jgi:DNA repair exonuclease SbcCD nuclease subunit
VNAMLQYAESAGIRTILFCGDFFHTPSRVNTEVLEAAASIIQNANGHDIHIYALMGNHDMKTDRLSSINVLHGSHFHPICFAQHFDTVDGIPVSALPYTEDPEILANFLRQVSNRNDILLLHQGVRDVELNSKGFTLNEILGPDMIPDSVIQAFSGHYHSHKKVSDKLIIPGSLMQLTWADKGETRGFLDVRYDGVLHVRHIDTSDTSYIEGFTKHISGANKFVEITSDFLLHSTLQEIKSAVVNNFVRVVTSRPLSPKIHKQLLDMRPFSLEVVSEESSEKLLDEVDATKFESMTELFEEYVTHCGLEEELAAEGRRIVNA